MTVDTANVTITGKIGPGYTVTSQLFTGVGSINFLIGQGIVRLGLTNQKNVDFEYTSITTITYTISSHVGTVTIS